MENRQSSGLSPWHAGERQLHKVLGIEDRMDHIGRRVLRDYMTDQHIELFEKLPQLFIGLVDAEGWPWASILEGDPGFMRAIGTKRLRISSLPPQGDPLRRMMQEGSPIGTVALEYQTRRRNRMNGRILSIDEAGFDVRVEQAFGNCPQYIQARDIDGSGPPSLRTSEPKEMQRLSTEAVDLIRNADTFFVSSYADTDDAPAARQVDTSHRGGLKGFVRVEDNSLVIPDFSGNQFFNTFGNILQSGRAGLLFVDAESGTTLQLTGTSNVLLDSPSTFEFLGAERFWSVNVLKAVLWPGHTERRYRLHAYSPSSLMTGSWEQAAAVPANNEGG